MLTDLKQNKEGKGTKRSGCAICILLSIIIGVIRNITLIT